MAKRAGGVTFDGVQPRIPTVTVEQFVATWRAWTGTESAGYAPQFNDLCRMLEGER